MNHHHHHHHHHPYKVLSDDDIDFFIRAIGAENVAQTVVTKRNEKKKKKTPYVPESDNDDNNSNDNKSENEVLLNELNTDWQKKYFGKSKCALFPNERRGSEILRYCHENHIAVCPQGGNTGLVGGAVPVFDEVILSLKRMNSVLSIDDITGVCVCEAGVVLEELGRCSDATRDVRAFRFWAQKVNVKSEATYQQMPAVCVWSSTALCEELFLGLEVVLADGTALSSLLRENRKR